jgi:L-lactate dehydrogenase (cytochrome)
LYIARFNQLVGQGAVRGYIQPIGPRELASHFAFERPSLRRADRALDAVTIADLRRSAQRALPRTIFDFLEGGAEDEVALRRNRTALDAVELLPRVLRDVSRVELATSFLGVESSAPIGLAPTGFTRLIHHDGEPAVARAAAAAGIPYVASTMSNATLEEIAAASPAPKLFQLFMWRDREVCARLLERAQAAGYAALVLTVDSQVAGLRERDARNGLTVPPTIRPRALLDGLRRPGWSWAFARGEQVAFANLAFAADGSSLTEYVAREMDTALSWEAVDWLRERWDGPFAIKGILHPDDARLAREHGASAVIVSNHGGRQLGSAAAPIDALPAIVAAVGDDLEVLLDSGVRRGADVVKALALGARACLVGRPYLYGLAAAGEPGAARAIEILVEETRRTIILAGAPRLADLDAGLLRTRL